MPSNHTEHYELNQWVKSDQVLMDDFNADNRKIDAAIKAVDVRVDGKADQSALDSLSETVTAQGSAMKNQSASIAKLGNCEVYLTSYEGTGSGLCAHTFPHYPVFVLIRCQTGGGRTELVRGVTTNSNSALASGDTILTVSWSGNKLTWSANSMKTQLNETGKRYYILALLDTSR